MTLRDLVFAALNGAKENGYDTMLSGPSCDIAGDVIAYDDDVTTDLAKEFGEELSDRWVDALVPIIDDWRSIHDTQGTT
jgi:hypothetical protein